MQPGDNPIHGFRLPRLINRLHPFPFETMESYLERLRQANHYERPGCIAALLPRPVPHSVNTIRLAAHYQALHSLTDLSLSRVAELTIHRFVSRYYTPDCVPRSDTGNGEASTALWESSRMEGYVHGRTAGQVCPLCWRRYRVLLLPWSLRLVTTCPIHGVLLVDTCQKCHGPLSADPAQGACRRCGFPLARLAAVPIRQHETSLLLTRIIWEAIGCGDEFLPSAGADLVGQHPLFQMASAAQLHFFWSLTQLLVTRARHSPVFLACSDIEPIQRAKIAGILMHSGTAGTHKALAALCQLLIAWPDGWHATLDRIAAQERRGMFANRRFPYALARLFRGTEWQWLHDATAQFIGAQAGTTLVHPWLPYYRRAQEGAMSSLPILLTLREAARELHMSEECVQQVIEGERGTTPVKVPRRHWQLVDAELIRRLKLGRQSELTLSQAAAQMGVSEKQLVALVAAGLLRAERGPLIGSEPSWAFRGVAVQGFLDQLLSGMPEFLGAGKSHRRVIGLPQATRIVSWSGVRLPRIIQAIQSGELPAYRVAGPTGLQALRFERAALTAWQHRQHNHESHHWYTPDQVCRHLRCRLATLRRLGAAGLLVAKRDETDPGRVRMYYDSQDVVAFTERYITTDAAARHLGVTRLTVQRWARLGRIRAVTGPPIDGSHSYRFDKAELVEWRHQRLTMGEACRALGVSRATIHRWVDERRIEPLASAGGKQRWFAREVIERACTSLRDRQKPTGGGTQNRQANP